MKRAVFLYSLIFVCLAASSTASGQSAPRAKKACPFSITGLWQTDATARRKALFFSFSPNGWVKILEHSAGTLPQDFEILTEVRYRLDKPAAPRVIEFSSKHGNAAFSAGTTFLDITGYDDRSFTTRNPVTGEQARWEREQSHRFFLTFAARGKTAYPPGPALAMLTVLDGRKTEIDALGVHLARDEAGKTAPAFGPVPADLYNQFTSEGDIEKNKKDGTAIFRLELTQSEYEGVARSFETWKRLVKDKALPHGSPYMNGLEFLTKTAELLNKCGEKVKLHKTDARDILPRHALEFIRELRRENDKLHVADAIFPWGWQPMLQPGQ
ncbi:MAG TPA: hypothetical protein VNO14_12135 [Blastocatellia bacterium]|nr:hypothetical protein [Blastocatellia bacterium]